MNFFETEIIHPVTGVSVKVFCKEIEREKTTVVCPDLNNPFILLTPPLPEDAEKKTIQESFYKDRHTFVSNYTR